MKVLLSLFMIFGLFLQNVFATDVKSEKLKTGIVTNRDGNEGRSEPCRT